MSKIKFRACYTTSSSYSDDISAWIESIELSGITANGKIQLAQDGTYTWMENNGTTGKFTLEQKKDELTYTPLPRQGTTNANTDLSTEAGTLCLVPQTLSEGAKLIVNIRTASETSKKHSLEIPLMTGTIWEGGKSYIYNLTITEIDGKLEITAENPPPTTWDIEYTAEKRAQTFLVPKNATYKIEIWGNQGGIHSSSDGKGGYTTGDIKLTKGDVLNIYVGESNYSKNLIEGWNGGGRAGGSSGGKGRSQPGAGSIDVRFKYIAGDYDFNNIDKATDKYPLTGLTGIEESDPRIIVGGGGGGHGEHESGGSVSNGGCGGGESGGDCINNGVAVVGGKGGTQTTGGISDRSGRPYSGQTDGSAGKGGNAGDGAWSGGGGGGWWGGGAGSWYAVSTKYFYVGSAGGGGSSHVHSKLFTNILYKRGDEAFSSPDGVEETGHTKRGLVRITLLSDPAPTP